MRKKSERRQRNRQDGEKKNRLSFHKSGAALFILLCVTSSFADTRYNNDAKADIAFYNAGGGFGSLSVLFSKFSRGNGTWDPFADTAPAWANQPGVIAVPGDFDGDGRTDIAFYCPGCSQAWDRVRVLFSKGDGTWASGGEGLAPAWVNWPGVVAVPGDFDGDGKTDLAFYCPGCGWADITILFSNGDGSWRPVSNPVPAWANALGAIAAPGVYHNSGGIPHLGNQFDKTDIAFVCPGCVWNTVPVLLSNGDGSWNSVNDWQVPAWANAPGVFAVPGHYGLRLLHSSLTDIAFYCPACGWNSIPVLFSTGDGNWGFSNSAAPCWANQPGVVGIPGDYDGDGRTDLAFIQPGSGSDQVPVLLHNPFHFPQDGPPPNLDNGWTGQSTSGALWANLQGVVAVPGDYDGDGKGDIAFYCPGCSPGWNTVPVLFSKGDGSWRQTNESTPAWSNQAGVVAVQNNYRFGHPPPLSLSFTSINVSLLQGNSQNEAITIPNALCTDTRVTVNPSNPNVSINGAPAGSQVGIVIPQGATSSNPFPVQGVQPGQSKITASAVGFQDGVLNVIVLAPGFSVSVVPQTADIPWGQPATYSVTITGQNISANLSVNLEAVNLPYGAKPSFAPDNSVMLAPANPTQTRTLSLNTTEAATKPGTTSFSVKASGSGIVQYSSASVHVARTKGDLSQVTPNQQQSGVFHCARGGMTANAVVSGHDVTFSVDGAQGNVHDTFTNGYTFSPACRAGVVQGDVGQNGLRLYNLEFVKEIGATRFQEFQAPGTDTGIYFSPDDSLAVVISGAVNGPYSAAAFDMTGRSLSGGPSQGTFTATGNFKVTIAGNTITLTDPGLAIPIKWAVP